MYILKRPNTECSVPLKALLAQIDAWKTDENCKQGGEKCLYTLVSSTATTINAKHTTPVKKYVDDLTLSFKTNGNTCSCDVILTCFSCFYSDFKSKDYLV